MKILFIGQKKGNSLKRYNAIKFLNKKTEACFTEKLHKKKILNKIFYHISPEIINPYLNLFFKNNVKKNYDLIFVNNEAYIAKNTLNYLKSRTKKIILYCNDNPFLKRDKMNWRLLKKSLPYFDKIFFEIHSRLKYSKLNKLKNCISILPQYDKQKDRKYKLSNFEKKKFKRDIVFIGNWFPERGKFFLEFEKYNLDFKIYGVQWDKDKSVFNKLRHRIENRYVENPEYSKIISSAKIAICLLSKANDDDITTRTIEIPAIGSLLLSEETKVQKKILIENKEAVYFKNADECAQKCKNLLKNPRKIKTISKKGNYKITKILKPEGKNVMKKILEITFLNKNTKKFIYRFD